ncbi:MAG: hypothetical protein WEE89_12995 [Gemmatimonadota bacterium]
MRKPKTLGYIDGFNLYHRALEDTPHKWLNVAEKCRVLLPPNDIQGIRYFMARVNARAHDLRQQTYLRALETIPALQIFFGHF